MNEEYERYSGDENYSEMELKAKREASSDKLANAAFVLGIISLVSILCCCPFIFSALGIILALLSKGASESLKPRAKTGLIMSIISMVVALVLTIFTIGFPIFMYLTNPKYKEIMLEQYEEVLDDNEDLLRELYGEEMYEELQELLEEAR